MVLMRWLVILLAVTASSNSANCAEVRTVALSDHFLPNSGATGASFQAPLLNDAGFTSYEINLYGGGVSSTVVWTEWAEVLGTSASLVYGQVAPGSGGARFASAGSPPGRAFNSASQLVTHQILTGPGVNSSNRFGLYSWDSMSGLQFVARAGMPAPGGATGDVIERPILDALGDDGRIMFSSLVLNAVDAYSATWIKHQSGYELVVRDGEAAPGTNSIFDGVGATKLNRLGGILLSGGLVDGDAIAHVNDFGIWARDSAGNSRLVVRTGDPVPDLGGDVRFEFLWDSALSDSGLVTFAGRMKGGAITSSNRGGIWREWENGALQLIAREGGQAPGTIAGVMYRDLTIRLSHNANGDVAFQSGLTGPGVNGENSFGIWADRGMGDVQLVARGGQNAPGTEAGIVFESFDWAIINDAGQVAFQSFVDGPGIDHTNRLGIWAETADRELRLIARCGDLLEVAPGDFRTIVELEFESGNPRGFSATNDFGGFNNRGQVAFHARFSDGSSGIFVSNAVMIPETGSFALAFIGGIGLSACGRIGWRTKRGRRCPLTAYRATRPCVRRPIVGSTRRK